MKRFVLLMMVAFFAAQPQLFAQNQQKKIEILIEPTYERVAGDYSRSLPYVYVKKDGLWGYINVFEGKEILPPKYTQASIFNNGEAVVELDGKRKVFINLTVISLDLMSLAHVLPLLNISGKQQVHLQLKQFRSQMFRQAANLKKRFHGQLQKVLPQVQAEQASHLILPAHVHR